MSFTEPPFLMGNGAQHSAESARALPFLITGPYNGIGSPTSFKVTASPTPDGNIRILPGVAAVYDTHTQNSNGSYVVREATEMSKPVGATTSAGGRSDLVVLRINDPSQRTYAGAPTAQSPNPNFKWWDIEIISGVPSNTGSNYTNGGAYPILPLARIDIPTSTGTITNAMITDLRRMGTSRTHVVPYVAFPTVNTAVSISGFYNWPDTAGTQIDIPIWATKMIVVSTLTGIRFSGTVRSDVVFRGMFAGQAHAEMTIATIDSPQRFTHVHATSWSIPSNMRGTKQSYAVQGKQQNGNGGFWSETYSTIVHQVYFLEEAE